MKFISKHWILLLLLLLTSVAYLPALSGEFLIDDERMARSPFEIRKWADLALALRTGFDFDPRFGKAPPSDTLFNTYRPIPITTLLLLKSCFGSSVVPYHLFNLGLHLCAVALAYLIACCFFRFRWSVLLATGFFAFHPFLADAVAWINGLSDPLAFIFLAAAMLALLRIGNDFAAALSMSVAYFVALLCKETALVFVGVIPLLAVLGRRRWRRPLLAVLGAVSALALCWHLRRRGLGSGEVDVSVLLRHSFLSELPFFVGESLGRFFSVFHTHVVMVREEWRWLDWAANPLGKSVGAVVCLTAAALCAVSVARRTVKPLWLFLAMAGIFLAPVLYVLHFKYASPRMFYPSIFAAAMVLGSLSHWVIGRGAVLPVLRSAIVSLLGLIFLGLVLRTGAYRSPEDLWRAEIRNNPSSPYGYHFYAFRLMKDERFLEGIPFQERALELAPDAIEVQRNLGIAFYHVGKLDRAEALFEKIVSYKPKDCRSYRYLHLIARRRGQAERARQYAGAALRECPHYPEAAPSQMEPAAQDRFRTIDP